MAEPKPEKKVRGVFERPAGSGIWWISYFDRGKHRRERVGRKSDAIQLYRKRKTQILQGEKLPELNRKRVTFGDLLDKVLEYARDHCKSVRDYEGKAELMKPAFGGRAAEDIHPDEFGSWIRKRKVSNATFNRYKAFVSACYREGMRARMVKANPMRDLKRKREPKGRQAFLTRAQYAQLRDAIEAKYGADKRTEFVTSIHSGMRLSEQYGLQRFELLLDRRVIALDDTKNGDPRDIPMTSELFAELEGYVVRHKLTSGRAKVFARPRGGKGQVQTEWFEGILRDCSITNYTWHNNRHTFCSWLAMAGVPLKTIQELAGHKTISVTAKYAHLSPDHKSTEIERLVESNGPRVLEFPTSTRTSIA